VRHDDLLAALRDEPVNHIHERRNQIREKRREDDEENDALEHLERPEAGRDHEH